MIFKIFKDSFIQLKKEVLQVFEFHVQYDSTSKEAGGLLIGRMLSDSNDIVIDFASQPADEDVRKRFFFFRKKEPAQSIVNKKWEESDGTWVYLGEWHTHPEPIPTPSKHDLDNWKSIYKDAKFEQKYLIFIIVGTESIGCWVQTKNECKSLDATEE